MTSLVLLEHEGQEIKSASLSAIRLAQELGQRTGHDTWGILMGSGVSSVAEQAAAYLPVLLLDHAELAHPVADRDAEILARIVRQYDGVNLVATSNTTTKDVVARAAGLLGGAMVSDVVSHEWVENTPRFTRPMHAGSVLATVELLHQPRIITIRATAFPPARMAATRHDIQPVAISLEGLPAATEWLGSSGKASQRPDVAEASIVVSGGRAFKSREDFEQLVGGLADALHGAAGSSRALVDAGITPNEMQVGQTGKIIAPDLYVALGISGAVQHLAGMKNSKVIVAINQDPDAPIFEVANYGWVADVYQVVPEIINALQRNLTSGLASSE